MPISVKCPKCGEAGDVPTRLLGKRIECHTCGHEFEALAPKAVEQSHRYKMVQVPPAIAVREGTSTAGKAANYLEGIVNQHAVDGWEFYRVDEIGIQINPGCLAGLFGVQSRTVVYYVITFRRPV